MDSSSSDERGNSMNNKRNKISHRHTSEQIQRLEAYFKERPHPNDSQRRNLGEELNLKQMQIKFWFQNKRTQVKTQSDKASNLTLRMENMRLKREKEEMEAALKHPVCIPCGRPIFGREERELELELQNLRLENFLLKQEPLRSSCRMYAKEKMDSSSMNNEGPKFCHRLSNEQTQRLEAYFKDCPHPEDSQQRKLGEELNLRPGQLKFWFQNKRAQVKNQGKKTNNSTLRLENLRLQCENEAMESIIWSKLNTPTGGPPHGREERQRNLEKLRFFNYILKKEHERLSSIVDPEKGKSVDSSTSVKRPSLTSNSRPPAIFGTSSNHLLERPSLLSKHSSTHQHRPTTSGSRNARTAISSGPKGNGRNRNKSGGRGSSN